MRGILAFGLLCVCAGAFGAEPVSISRTDDAIAKLTQQVERLTEAVARLEQLRGETGEVPEVAITKKVPGQWLIHPQTGMMVYAKSQWHTYNVGRVKVVELIRDGITPVPVGSVTFGDSSVPAQTLAYPAGQGRSMYEQSQRLR